MPEGTATLFRRIAWLLVCVFVFTIPWEKSLLVPGLGTLTRLVGVLAFAGVAGLAVARRSVRPPNVAVILAVAFAGWTALTWFWSISPGETAARALTFAQLAAMFWVLWETCRTHTQQALLMHAYIAGAGVAAVLTVSRYVREMETYYHRYAAPGFDPNDLGLTVALSVPFALYLSLESRGPVRWLYRLAITLATAAVLLSASRTALLITAAAYLFVLLTWRTADKPARMWGVGLFALLIAGALYLAPPASRQRLATLPAEAAQGNLHNRTRIWKAGLRVARSRPVVGVGAGTFATAVRPQLGVPEIPGHAYVAHNTYLSVLVESGLIGLGLFTLFLGALAAFVWMMPLAERALWSVALGMWALGVTVLSWEHRKPGWLLFGLIMTEWARSFRRSGAEK